MQCHVTILDIYITGTTYTFYEREKTKETKNKRTEREKANKMPGIVVVLTLTHNTMQSVVAGQVYQVPGILGCYEYTGRGAMRHCCCCAARSK